MTTETTRQTRRERRAAALAARRAERRLPEARSHRSLGIGAISLLALVGGLVIVAILTLTRTQPPATPGQQVVAASVPAAIASTGFTLGRADAPVAIDVYEDFQCPACLRWGQAVFPSLARNEIAAGRARLVFHGYAFIGPESVEAGKAAWAASRQDRFWDMWATLYANQGLHENGGAFSHDRLVAMADAIDLDPARFAADFASAAAAAAVKDGIDEALRAGVQSTPTVLVNGQPFTGATYPDLAAAIAGAAE
jgi:protein-disulfide isomerase